MQMRTIALLLLSIICKQAASQQHYMFVGTYNSPDSQGIYVYKFNSETGSAEQLSQTRTSNPSYLVVSPDKKFVYAVNEEGADKGGKVASFSFNKKNGNLTLINIKSSGGIHPCYINTDKKGKWILAGNYSSGSLSVLPVKKGILSNPIQTLQHTGNGPDTIRQKSPHVHGVFIKKNSQFVYVTDLGIDKVMIYQQSKKTGMLSMTNSNYFLANPGSGPRHLDFHPNGRLVYLLNELTSAVSVLEDKNGTLKEIQSLSALPLTFKGISTAADIHVSPDGKFLYSSNRGTSNSIAIFSIEQQTGLLTIIGHQYTGGETPRNFNFDPSGNFLLVANQNSNNIVIFKRNKDTGLLSETGNKINVGKPVCIKWAD
jgi:6-phosphogluconolactonase